jgi:outer membrane immunogenic protein
MFRKFLLSSVALGALLSALTVFLVFSGIGESRAECIFPCVHNSGAALAADPSMAPPPVYVPPPILAALAADVPSMAPPPVYVPPPVFTWTGFYVGVNGGGAVGSPRFDFTNLGISTTSDTFAGGFVGGTVGYDWQWSGRFVVGILADADWADITNTSGGFNCAGTTITCKATGNFLGSVRGRIGYAWERVLFYASGGLGLGNVRFSVTDNLTGLTASDNVFRAGFAVGGGLEYALVPSWAVKFEYVFYDFQNTNFTPGGFDPAIAALGPVTTTTFVHTFRAGIDYKFLPPPPVPPTPVVAKY